MIIDVDTHWEAIAYDSQEFPLAPWADDLPSGVDMLAFGVAGDLLRALPEADQEAPAPRRPARESFDDFEHAAAGQSGSGARIAQWLLVLSLAALAAYAIAGRERVRGWLGIAAEQPAGGTDR